MKNETTEVYRGKNIRTYNIVRLRVSQYEVKQFIDARIDQGLSARKLLEISSTPCDCCKNTTVISYQGEDVVKVKRGILCNTRKNG